MQKGVEKWRWIHALKIYVENMLYLVHLVPFQKHESKTKYTEATNTPHNHISLHLFEAA